MMTFIWENGKAVAQEGYNDDLIMSLAIGLWVRDTSLKIYERSQEIQRMALDGIKKVTGGVEPAYRPNYIQYDPYKMPVRGPNNPYGIGAEDEDLRWLIS
jgi:hypothetical protein